MRHFGTCPTPKKSKIPTGRTGGDFSFASYSPMDLTVILTYTKNPGHFVILGATFWRRNCTSKLWLSSLCDFYDKPGKTGDRHVSPGLPYYVSCRLDTLRLASAF